MTSEKAIKILNEIIDEGWLISDMEKCVAIDACEMAIEALSQEPILDKIKAEINTMPCAITSMREIYVNRDKVINIIDKYKAESEVRSECL